MGRKTLTRALLIFCVLCLTACTQETGNTNETTSVANKSQEDEFLVVSDMHTADEDSGYAIDYKITKWSIDTFEGQVMEVSDIIRQQYADYNPVSSASPGWWRKDFDSSDEIMDYLGCDMLNIPTWDLEETNSSLTVNGDEEGNIERLFVEVDYVTDNLRMQSFSYIFTEFNHEDSMFYGISQIDTYTQEEGLTSDGLQYVVITSGENLSGYICKDGFLIKNGVMYNFHLAYTAAYEQEAKERLEQWFTNF